MYDGYLPLRVLGRGSTGAVFEAWSEHRQRTVALKVVRPDCRDAFEREQRATAALAGTAGVIRLLDTRSRAGTPPAPPATRPAAVSPHPAPPYLVLEHLGGRSLDQWLRRCGPAPPGRLAALGISLLDTLEAVHAAGWVHGDVKPANVFLGNTGAPTLVDFGCALPRASRRFGPAPVTGTTAHLAPEVLAGAPSTPASDLYGLGSTLWTLLTGQPPFGTGAGLRDHAFAQRVVDEPVPDPRRRGAPPPLGRLLERLLDKDPGRRSMRWQRRSSR